MRKVDVRQSYLLFRSDRYRCSSKKTTRTGTERGNWLSFKAAKTAFDLDNSAYGLDSVHLDNREAFDSPETGEGRERREKNCEGIPFGRRSIVSTVVTAINQYSTCAVGIHSVRSVGASRLRCVRPMADACGPRRTPFRAKGGERRSWSAGPG